MNQKTGKALLDALRTNGIDNISLVAKSAGLHVETVRYAFWYEMPSRGLSVNIEFNYELMGLEQWMLHLTFSNRFADKIILEFLKEEIGIVRVAKPLLVRSLQTLILIPIGQHERLKNMLDLFVSLNCLVAYELEKVKRFRPISLDLDFYDIKRGAWNIDWYKAEMGLASKSKLAKAEFETSRKFTSTFAVDYKDLQLIQRMQVKVPSTITKLAKRAGIFQCNARYHYNNHVKRLIRSYSIRAKRSGVRIGEPEVSFLFQYSPQRKSDLADVRACALSLPFITAEWETDTKYWWLINCPQEHIRATFEYISEHTPVKKGFLNYEMLDSDPSERWNIVPIQMFDEAHNRWSFEPKISTSRFNVSFDTIRSHCNYQKSGACYCEWNDGAHQCKLVSCKIVSNHLVDL